MDLSNKNITDKSISFTKDFKEKVKSKVSDKFDISVIGKIDLAKAEEIAKEEVFFLTENDIIESLEDFELVSIKYREDLKKDTTKENFLEKKPDNSVDKLERPPDKISRTDELSGEIVIDDYNDVPAGVEIDSDFNVDETEILFDEKTKIPEETFQSDSDFDFFANTLIKDDYNGDINKIDGAGVLKDEEESKLIDITNDIIILEDKEKLIELTSEFPEKRDHLVKLLSYLDGLFEKLPEDVIRKFAESEYFDLYSKILKDMDS
ncbi:MAG: hypothetical protein FWF73_02675 [Spirochaetes bacterium]|nr:hypothetical protein [Spirochaetota bacterium]